MARFTGVPELPQSSADEWQMRVLEALKQNVELLTGTRGEPNDESRAIVKSSLTVSSPPTLTYGSMTARGAGFSIGNAQVPSFTDYTSLIQDVQRLSTDVANLHAILSTLVSQLRK